MNAGRLWRGLMILLHLFTLPLLGRSTEAPGATGSPESLVVRQAFLNPTLPVFVPVHPRIATTVSFPKPIGQPMGTGFVDADAYEKAAGEGKTLHHSGEYVITYLQGETFFTVQPIRPTELLNLNVPYEGATVVLYFFPVEKPLQAVASLIFSERAGRGAQRPAATAGAGTGQETSVEPPPQSIGIRRSETTVASPYAATTPARLEGFLRKLRLVHAAKLGEELDEVAAALKLKVAVSAVEDPASAEIPNPISAGSEFDLIVLRVARDPALDAIGFVVLFRNKAQRELVLDLRTLSARCGGAFYTARAVDAPASLKPGELRAGYFCLVGSEDGRPAHLSPGNDWRLSVEQVSAEPAVSTPAEVKEATP